MSNITNEITLLFKTRLDEKSKTEIGKNLKGLLENAVITFDEAEIKKSLQPIVQMMKTMFDQAGMAFDADKLLGMPSKQALQSMANLSIKDLQMAYDKAVANSGGINIDFGNMDFSALSSTLNGIAADVEAVNQKMANSTKKSTSEIEASINRLKPSTKVMVDGVEQAGGKLEKTVSHIEKTLERVNKPSHMYNENSATNALEAAREKYINSVTKNDPWEVQYQYMLSFVSKYEAMSQKIKPIIDTNRPEFKNLYDTLAPQAGAAKISLEHFVDIARGNEFSEYKNQPWARESTLKNIEQVLRAGISVKSGTNDGPNNSELNNNKTDSPSKTIDDNQKSQTVPDKSTSAAVNKVKKEATPDTSAFNQELFNAIEKFSNVVEKAFKSMRSGKIDEDSLDDQRAAAIQQLLNKFKFNSPQRVDDYLYEKSDDMGAWDSKKIYNKLSKQLSSKDPSWTKIQNKDVATRQNNTAAITAETEAQENLNKVEAQNPPAKDESSVHNANTNAIEKEAQTQEKLNNNKIQEPTSKDDVSQINVETEALQKQAQIQNDINTSKTNEQPAVNDTPQIQTENTVLDEQNAKLKENIALKGQTKDVGTGGTKTTSDVVTSVQPVPAGTVSTEATELDSVRVKIEEVIAAVNTKTAAFTAESAEVQRAVGVENIALNSLKENIETVTTAVKNKTQAFTAEGAEVQRVVDAEINALNNLEQKKINSSVGNNAAPESVQTQPISVASTEVVELDAIKTKLIEVTSAVNAKTQAFLAEQKAVKSVAQSEVHAMGQVGQSVTAVRVALNNLQTKQHKINLTVAGGEDVANISATETQALTKLRAALQLTTKRVNEKTQAFNNEKTVVNSVVNSEVNALNRLNTQVGAVNKTVMILLQNIQSAQAGASTITIPQTKTSASSQSSGGQPTVVNTGGNLLKMYERLGALGVQKNALDPNSAERKGIEEKIRLLQEEINKKLKLVAVDKQSIAEAQRKGAAEQRAQMMTVDGRKSDTQAVKDEKAAINDLLEAYERLGTLRAKRDMLPKGTNRDELQKEIESETSRLWNRSQRLGVDSTQTSEASDRGMHSVMIDQLINKTKLLGQYKKDIISMDKGSGAYNNAQSRINELNSEIALIQKKITLTQEEKLELNALIQKNAELVQNKSVDQQDKVAAERAAKIEQLKSQYIKLGEAQANAEHEGTNKAKERFSMLTQEIENKQQSLQLTQQELDMLKKIVAESYQKQSGILAADKQDKDKKRRLADEKKMHQKEAMLGKANSAVNRAENTWMNAVGLEGNLSSSFTAEVDSYYQKLDALRRKHEELKSSELISPEQQKELINQTVEINKMTAEIGELVAEYQKLSGSNVNPENVRSTALLPSDSMDMYKQQLTSYVREITNGQGQIKNFDATTRTLTYTVKTGAHEFTEYTAAVRRADNSLVSVQGSTKRTETFLETTKRKMKEISSYMSGMMLFYRAMSVFRQGIQYIKEIDTALTELKKVTDETEETYSKFLDTAAETAEKVGSTIQKIISSTADWARLGYSMKQAAKFAESTQILMNVSEFTDVSQATDTLISAVQAFEYTAETSMEVVDLLNTIGNNYAISTADLAQSLTKSSASLVAAGGDLAEAAALTATANAVIQDADAVGTALKTTSLRLRGTSVDVLEEEGIDSDGAVTSKSKLQSKVKAISGIDILTETGEYKSTYQILSQIADVWEDISDIDQAALLEMLAGKRNASVLAAILQAPEELKDAYEDANNASGSAVKENEKYLESIQGRMDVFTSSVQTMWNNVIGSDTVKWFVTLGTIIIQIIDKVGLLNTALIALGAFKGGKFLLNVLSGMGISFKELTARLSQYLIGVNATTVATHQLTQAQLLQKLKLTGLTDEMAGAIVAETGLGVSTETLSAKQLKAALIAKGYSEELANETVQKVLATATTSKLTFTESLAHTQLVKTLATRALVRAAQKQGITLTEAEIAAKLKDMTANQMLSMSFKELGVSMLNVGKKILPLIAAIAAIAAVVWVVDELTTTTEEAKEAFDEFNSVLSETESQLDKLESQLSDINSQIEELNSQGALTFTDREELQRLKAQSNEIQRQIDLTENLKKQQQTQVNGAALTMADMYEDIGMTTGKTTEELKSTGGTAGAVVGGAGLGIAGAMGAGASIGIAGGPVGLIVGAVVGAIVGAIIGVAGGAAVGAAEEKVGDSLDNMKKQYEKLQSEYNTARANYQKDASEDNKEKFEEAQEAFNGYQSNMANYMTEMNSYYSQIKANWDVATKEQKQAYNEWADTMDTWAIQTGGQNAKSNALDRLFGKNAEGGFAIARDRVDEIKEKLKDAQETGDELAIANALKELEDFKLEGILSEEEVERLRNLGLYLYEAEDRFKDVVKTESEFINNDLEDVAKDINKIEEGLESLKSAFEEVLEEEVLTAKTLKSLKEELKIESSYSDVEEVQDAWRNYLDTMMSGAATTEEMTNKTEELAQAILDAALAQNDLKPETKYEYVAQLRQLGVANAEEYVDNMLQKNIIKEIEDKVNINAYLDVRYRSSGEAIKQVEELAEKYNVEKDAIDAIIEKLKEKQDLEKQKANIESDRERYKGFINEYQRTTEDIKALVNSQKITEVEWEESAADIFGKATQYRIKGLNNGDAINITAEHYKELQKYQKGTEEYNKAFETAIKNGSIGGTNASSELYQSYIKLFDLWNSNEGQKWLDANGNLEKGVDTTFEAAYIEAKNRIDTLTGELQKEFTIDIDLKLKLQDKSELVDDIQNTFDTLVNAQKEYDENGYVSVDTLQSLLELEPKYLDLLVDEKGNLNLTKDALYDVARARITDMGIQQQKNILEKANQLASKGSTDALREQITVMQGANAEGKNFIDTQMEEIRVILKKRVALGELTPAEADAFVKGTMNQIKAVQVATQSALDNLENSLSSAGNTKKQEMEDAFKKAMEYWENRIGANQSLYEQIQNDIDLLEKKGQIAGESYYQAQIDVEKEHLQHLKDQRAEATEFLKGEKRGTERWWDIANTLNDIAGEIDGVTASIQDLSDAMAQVHWDVFDQVHERMDDLTAQLSNVREILSADEDSFFTDEGEWSDTGIAVLATHIQDIAVAESTLADVEKELKNLKMSDFDSENEYYDKLTELTEKQQDYTMAISDSKQAVVDMYESNIDAVEEYFDKLIENYSDYIDSVKEALDAERDLYDFKKKVQNESKNIAELERKIASLSGSQNKSDIAEKRKLESELYKARESLNDTYYDHAKQSQQDALDAEQTAYEETLTKMVEGMRLGLKEATTNMQAFLDSVTIAVSMNADTVLNKYQSTELYLSPALTNPWEAAKKAVGEYGGDANNLMDVWAKDGYFAKFSSEAGTNLKSPFNAGKTAADEFGKSVGSAMTNVYNNIQSNVQKSVTELDKIKQKYKEINDETIRPSGDDGNNGNSGKKNTIFASEGIGHLQMILNKFFSAKLKVNDLYDSATEQAVKDMQKVLTIAIPSVPINGKYDQKTKDGLQKWLNGNNVGSWFRQVGFGIPEAVYAKGTTGTTRDQWAITDEPQFGDELVLVPGKDGNLSFMRKGTGVVPADMTQKLFELAQIPTSDLMNKNLTAIVPNITKNDFKNEFNFESLVHVDTVDSDTLPKLEKMVDKKIDDFSKALNYSIKRFAR